MSTHSAAAEAAYLAAERTALTRSDYLNGTVFPLPAPGPAHAQLAANAQALLAAQLRGPGYQVLGGSPRLGAADGSFYTYLDAVVVQGDTELVINSQPSTLLNPALLVKVLPHIRAPHLPEVLELCYTIASVQHVLLLTEYAARVSLGSRTAEGLHVYGFTDLADVVLLPDLGLELPLADLYRGVPLRA